VRWRHALSYVVLAAVLLAALWVTTPPAPPPVTPPPSGETGPDVVGVTVIAGDHRVTAHRVEGRWEIAEPHGGGVTSDLVEALLAAVLNAPAEPVAPASREDEFGLDRPFARIELQRRDGKPAVVLIGNTNPTGTGVYGQLAGNPQILLMGLNVRYYVELMTR
jgi:hypothetical protein